MMFDEPMAPETDGDEEGTAGAEVPPARDSGSRRRWAPEVELEIAAILRLLAVRPWLVGGRHDQEIAAVRRNQAAITQACSRLGWVLIVERDLVRLRKSPPVRRSAWCSGGPTPQQASWFFLLVAGAESVAPRTGLGPLVAAARAAAADADLPVTNDIVERRAIVRALRMLHERGVVEQVEGDVDGFVEDENAPVLLAVHHTRLSHVIAHFGASDPAQDPAGWLQQVEREPDPARRMRRRLVDDAVVHAADLDDVEADWLSRRVRSDDGAQIAKLFGLHLERRLEGAAFVVPDGAFREFHELGPTWFPGTGTTHHAALLLCEHAARAGVASMSGTTAESPGPGWRGLSEEEVAGYLASVAAEHAGGRGGWRRDLTEDPRRLAEEVSTLLMSFDLLRRTSDAEGAPTWWFSPATGRWALGTAKGPVD